MFTVYKAGNSAVLHSSLQVLTTATEFFISLVWGSWDMPSFLPFRNKSLGKTPVLLYNAGNGLRNTKNVSTVH